MKILKNSRESLTKRIGIVVSCANFKLHSFREIQILKHENSVIKSREEQYRRDYEAEVRDRSKESAEFSYQIKELEEQLQEYEDENANLRSQLQSLQSSVQNNPVNQTPIMKASPAKASSMVVEEPPKPSEKAEDLDLKSMLEQNEGNDKPPEQQIADLK